MYYVYFLRSVSSKKQTYIGFTKDLKARVKKHNNGEVTHTNKFKPWKLITYVAFSNRGTALNFEKYLKVGSGKAFLNKRLT